MSGVSVYITPLFLSIVLTWLSQCVAEFDSYVWTGRDGDLMRFKRGYTLLSRMPYLPLFGGIVSRSSRLDIEHLFID